MISLIGREGTIRHVSPAMADLLGRSSQEIVGSSFRRFIALRDRRYIAHAWAAATAPGASGGVLWVTLLTHDGHHTVSAIMNIAPIADRDEFMVIYETGNLQAEQSSALTSVITALSSTLSLSQVFDLILEQVKRVIPGENSAILLMRKGQIHLARGSGYELAALQAQINDWLTMPNIRKIHETCAPLLIDTLSETSNWIFLEGYERIRSWIGFPLMYKSRFCGVLEITSERPDAFTMADYSIGQLFAQQAAAAIRHAQLYRAARVRAQRLKTINNIGTALIHLDDTNVLKVIARNVAALMTADVFYIALYDTPSQTIRLVQFLDEQTWQDNAGEFPVEGLVSYVMKQHRTLVIGDVEQEGYPVESPTVGSGRDPRNIVIVPLMARDEIVGVMSVQSYQPYYYSQAAITLLETIASQAAVTIRNAQLHEETVNRLSLLASLQQTSLRLSGRLDLPAINDLLIGEVTRLLQPDEIRIYTYETRAARLIPAVTRASAPPAVYSDGASESAAARVVATGHPLSIMTPAPLGNPDQPLTLLAYPIHRSKITYGAITLRYVRPNPLSSEQARTLVLLLSQVATALENARHSTDVNNRLAEMSALYQVAHQVTGRLELSKILDDVTCTLQAIFPCRACLIALCDEAGTSDTVHIRAAAGLPLEAVANLDLIVEDNVFRRTIDTGKKIYLPDLYTRDQALAYDNEIRSLLIVPLTTHERVLGALAIDSLVREAFTPDHERILAIAAAQIATSIDNAWLYQKARKQAEHLATANRELNVLNQLRDELVQNLSHELRNPLAFVKGYAELIRDGSLGSVNEQQVDALLIMESKSDTIARLISDILVLETLDQSHLQRTQLNIDQLATQAVIGARLTYKNNRIAFIYTSANQPIDVVGDADRLNQVIDNLIGNAVKFSAVDSEVEVMTERQGDFCLLSVRDEGIGIPADKLLHIFERFYQVEDAKRRFGGSGLGLAIVWRIVEAHNGTVHVESQSGRGSTFCVRLPLAGTSNALTVEG